MYRKIDAFLTFVISTVTGIFIGYALYGFIDYMRKPGFYDLKPGPWYSDILSKGIISILIVVIALIIKFFINRRPKS